MKKIKVIQSPSTWALNKLEQHCNYRHNTVTSHSKNRSKARLAKKEGEIFVADEKWMLSFLSGTRKQYTTWIGHTRFFWSQTVFFLFSWKHFYCVSVCTNTQYQCAWEVAPPSTIQPGTRDSHNRSVPPRCHLTSGKVPCARDESLLRCAPEPLASAACMSRLCLSRLLFQEKGREQTSQK